NVSPTKLLATAAHTPGVVSLCQLSLMVAELMPSASENDPVGVTEVPAGGFVGLSVTVPVAGLFVGAWTAGMVVSENCSCSMFQSVSTPSVTPWLSTVMLPFAWWVMVYVLSGLRNTAVSVSLFAPGVLISRTATMLPGSTMPLNTASCSVIPGRLPGPKLPVSAGCSMRS